jgi:hypothetical protein
MEEERALSLAQPNLVTFDIPAELLVQFKQDVRIVIKWPGLIGIPIPDLFLNQDVFKQTVREFEPMLVPRQVLR